MLRQKLAVLVLTTGIVLTLSASTILTPLWIDSIGNPNKTISTNISDAVKFHRVDSFFIILMVNVLFTVLSASFLVVSELLTILFKDSFKQPKRKRYPNSEIFKFFCIGFSDALASILFVYSSSGSRTAPHLQSIAANFSIPATFIIRFIIIRKRPTCRKLLCAMSVMIAEFVALIPQIFSLESKQSKVEDGGAKGIWGVLWPCFYFFGFVPLSAVSVWIEKSAKQKYISQSGGSDNVPTFHLLFWSYLFCLMVVSCLFWTDLLPVFGSTSSISEFVEVFLFNIKCFFGIDHCVINVHIYSALCMFSMLVNRFLTILFLKVAEGANYLSIIMSLQTPLVLLFWTLFDEDPFHWHPHLHLSTILSIVAVCIILPSIFLYNTGAPEVSLKKDTVQPFDGSQGTCLDRDDLYVQFMNSSSESVDGTVQ